MKLYTVRLAFSYAEVEAVDMTQAKRLATQKYGYYCEIWLAEDGES